MKIKEYIKRKTKRIQDNINLGKSALGLRKKAEKANHHPSRYGKLLNPIFLFSEEQRHVALQRLGNLDELRVGLFVKLECSWWAHPFATNRFKISSQQDIEAIRGIRKLKLYYDPSLSDPLASRTETEPPVATEVPWGDSQAIIHETESLTDEGFEMESSTDLETEWDSLRETDQDSLLEESRGWRASEEIKAERKRMYYRHRDSLKKVEDAYWKTLGKSKDIFKRVSSGHATALKQASQLVMSLNAVLDSKSTTMTLMDVFSSTGMAEGLTSHSLNVCILSLVVGRKMGLEPDELHQLGMGALFHDLGKRLLPMKVNFGHAGIMMEAHPEALEQHPGKGRELLEILPNFPPGSLQVVYQHHERLDGSGYPRGLKDPDISLFAKIVMVVDEYDELCNHTDPEKSLNPHETLATMFKNTKRQASKKFQEDIILMLIQTLSVFPPGTLVELTDRSLGIVTSINLNAPTKPQILLAVKEGAKLEAHMIDLAREDTLEIKKSLRPSVLPPKLQEFLSPRRTAVFLHRSDHTHPMNPGGR